MNVAIDAFYSQAHLIKHVDGVSDVEDYYC